MLYANEKVPIWNPDTGESAKTEEELALLAEFSKRIHDGKTLLNFKRSKGWKLMTGFLTSQIDDYKNKLALEPDLNKLRRYQEAVKAYSNVMNFIDWAIQDSKDLQEQQQTSYTESDVN